MLATTTSRENPQALLTSVEVATAAPKMEPSDHM